jgi:RNA-binding protein 5/10
MKTRSNEKKKESDNDINSAIVLTSMKKVSQDLVKWDERKSEIKNQLSSQEIGQSEKIEDVNNTNNSTATGNYICTLCRRQFSSNELLSRHEKESKLHASNVAKLKLDSKVESESENIIYRDRASERRAIHGQSDVRDNFLGSESRDDMSSDLKKRKLRTIVGSNFEQPPTQAPILADDRTNPGNQILRRMGWTDGEGLGKDSSGRVDSLAQSLNTQPKNGIGVDTLQMTGNFRDSVKQATKARFERISLHK